MQISDEATPTSGHFSLPDNCLDGLTEGHVFAVVKLDQDPPDAVAECGPPISCGATGNDLYPFSVDGELYDDFATSERKTTNLDPATSLTTWHLYEARSASGAWSVRINGATGGGDFFSTTVNTVAFRSTTLRVGSAPVGTSTLNGLMVELIFYERVLDSPETQDIYDYIEAEYGITLP